MTGSLQIKKGYYYIVLSYKDEVGKNKTKWISTKLPIKDNNKRKAEKLLRDTVAELDKNNIQVTNDILFSDYIKDHWLPIIKTQVKPNTYYIYEKIAHAHIIPYFELLGVSLQKLQPIQIQQYYVHKLEYLSANSIKRHHANIHKALDDAVKFNLISYNPSDRVNPPKKQQKFISRFYNDKQLKTLLNVIKDEPIESVILLAALYGLRRSEVLGLRWRSINFQDKTITINHTVICDGEKITYTDSAKNKSSYRTMPMLPEIEKHLLELKERQREFAQILGGSYNDNDYVCKRADGSLFTPNYISGRFKTILEANNLPHIRFHDLRHSSASLLISKGYSLKQVGEWLGHADIASTNIYAHLLFESKLDMGSSISNVLF